MKLKLNPTIAGEDEGVNSAFPVLSKINVGDHVESKNGLTYLSWSWALHELLARFPDSTWEVRRFGDEQLPFQHLGEGMGCIVEVEVAVNGLIRSCILPVLDYRNKPIEKPNCFDINTAIMRCATKAIAYHGLGLYIYQGEDLPKDYDPRAELKCLIDGLIDYEAKDVFDFLKDLVPDEKYKDVDELVAKLPISLVTTSIRRWASLLNKATTKHESNSETNES